MCRNRVVVALAVFAGCCWFVFLWQVLRISWLDARIAICLIAVALGVLSIWPTGFLILYQEVRWNVRASIELVPGLRFFILGVGLREELAKLICLLPLMPLLVRRRDEMLALVASACVGLGFAAEENINYFIGSLATEYHGPLSLWPIPTTWLPRDSLAWPCTVPAAIHGTGVHKLLRCSLCW